MARPKTVLRLVSTVGLNELLETLHGIETKMRTEIIAEAVSLGAEPMLVAAKRFAKRSERTGKLRKSIVKLVRKYPKDGVAVAIVGPVVEGWGKWYDPGIGWGTPSKRSTKGATTPAVKYAHLIEFGHHAVTGGSLRPQYNKVLTVVGRSTNGKAIKRWKRGTVKTAAKGKITSWVPAKPFMRPAYATTQGKVYSEMLKGVAAGVEKVRAKLVKQSGHIR